MFERPQRGERALMLHVRIGRYPDADERNEFESLADAAGAARVGELVVRLRDAHPRSLIGPGKLEELGALAESADAGLVLVDHPLTPAQERNLERSLCRRVVDRTGLILDIFALHAKTAEGKLQVELAQLEYSYQRQEGLWQHLERLGGGVGTRGPGETQLESDRRLLRNRMSVLRRRLADLARSRGVMRDRRLASAVPRIALAGYTNAGKSSLMNALTGAEVSTADALFETLDSTTRSLAMGEHRVLLSDTVGFVRDLPHQLVEAFASTLDEVRDADLILHVADAGEPWTTRIEQAAAVGHTLDTIGASQIPRQLVLNKIDACTTEESGMLAREHPGAIAVSARTGEGLDTLRERLLAVARARLTEIDVVVPYGRGEVIRAIYAAGRDIRHEAGDTGARVRALMPARAAAGLLAALEDGRAIANGHRNGTSA